MAELTRRKLSEFNSLLNLVHIFCVSFELPFSKPAASTTSSTSSNRQCQTIIIVKTKNLTNYVAQKEISLALKKCLFNSCFTKHGRKRKRERVCVCLIVKRRESKTWYDQHVSHRAAFFEAKRRSNYFFRSNPTALSVGRSKFQTRLLPPGFDISSEKWHFRRNWNQLGHLGQSFPLKVIPFSCWHTFSLWYTRIACLGKRLGPV